MEPSVAQPDIGAGAVKGAVDLTLLLQSGLDRSGKSLGLPYGSYARFILLFLQSEAVKKGSREIELGRSMRVWLGQMGEPEAE